jgi:hypothetical protein
MFLSARKYDSGVFIPDPYFAFLSIPDPGVKKAPDPGSATLVENTPCEKPTPKLLIIKLIMVFN